MRAVPRRAGVTVKEKFKALYMRIALSYARMSYANRRKVGCVIVQGDALYPGYNGTPHGWDNRCETEDGSVTLPHVRHAETNALDKMIRGGVSPVGATVFVTTAPCLPCADRLGGAGVATVYYLDAYRNSDGIEHLRKLGISVHKMEEFQCEQ